MTYYSSISLQVFKSNYRLLLYGRQLVYWVASVLASQHYQQALPKK
jgi:hypothetical protein